MASVPTSRDRSGTTPLIASGERSTSAPDLTHSPLSRTRAASQHSTHGELLRRAIALKQERDEIEEQMSKIEERLRVHEDVLFTDERQTLRARLSRLNASFESKQSMLTELQSQFHQLSETPAGFEWGADMSELDSSGGPTIRAIHNTMSQDDPSSDTVSMAPTPAPMPVAPPHPPAEDSIEPAPARRHTEDLAPYSVRSLPSTPVRDRNLSADAMSMGRFSDGDGMSPRSRRRSLRIARLEKQEHDSALTLQAVLLGMATRRQAAQLDQISSVPFAPDCQGAEAQCVAALQSFCGKVHRSGEIEGGAILEGLESTLQQCATCLLGEKHLERVSSDSVQVLANVYVRRTPLGGPTEVSQHQSTRQQLMSMGSQLDRAKAETTAAREECQQLELGMQELRLQLAHSQKRTERDLRAGLLQRQQQDEAVAAAVAEAKANMESAAHEHNQELQELAAAKSALEAEMPEKIVRAVTPLMDRIKALEQQLGQQSTQMEDMQAAWEMMTGSPYGVTSPMSPEL